MLSVGLFSLYSNNFLMTKIIASDNNEVMMKLKIILSEERNIIKLEVNKANNICFYINATIVSPA